MKLYGEINKACRKVHTIKTIDKQPLKRNKPTQISNTLPTANLQKLNDNMKD